MTQKIKTYFNWSTGKDAALAFYHLQKDKRFNIDRLLTSVNAHYNRVSMHGLRRELLEEQIHNLGLPITTIELPKEPSMSLYENKMKNVVKKLHSQGYTHSGFGDIFLTDLRDYREKKLKKYNIKCCFPLWQRNTKELIYEFLELGFKAIVICIKSDVLDVSLAGRIIDKKFIEDLPSNVDPCGENGEFHTFCYDGPIFKAPIKFSIGEKTYRQYKSPKQNDELENDNTIGFWFCDILKIN